MGRHNDPKHNEKISKALKGRVPWNKGLGVEDERIRKGIKTRRIFRLLRELVKRANISEGKRKEK